MSSPNNYVCKCKLLDFVDLVNTMELMAKHETEEFGLPVFHEHLYVSSVHRGLAGPRSLALPQAERLIQRVLSFPTRFAGSLQHEGGLVAVMAEPWLQCFASFLRMIPTVQLGKLCIP